MTKKIKSKKEKVEKQRDVPIVTRDVEPKVDRSI